MRRRSLAFDKGNRDALLHGQPARAAWATARAALYRGGVAEVVSVLIEDPDLGERLAERRLREAERACMTKVTRIPRGRWSGPIRSPELVDGFGLLLLGGLMSRRVGRTGRFGAELLGPGDLLRPWDDPAEHAAMPFETDWHAIQPTRLAILDRPFALRAARYPEIPARLLLRTTMRSRRLAATVAIVHEPRIEARVDMLLWTLAERWGVVRRDGVVLSLPLTHALLADMVAASRPAVTGALSRLTQSGRLRRQGEEWVLGGGPPPSLDSEESEEP
jgi:CRP/FNR family transcriptional regulator, cyclic AMP receptor protein